MTDTAQDIIDRLNRRLVRDASIYPGTVTISEQEIKVLANAVEEPSVPTEWELEHEDLQRRCNELEDDVDWLRMELRDLEKQLNK